MNRIIIFVLLKSAEISAICIVSYIFYLTGILIGKLDNYFKEDGFWDNLLQGFIPWIMLVLFIILVGVIIGAIIKNWEWAGELTK
jgi:hypothetical protein